MDQRLRKLAAERLSASGFDVRMTDDGLYALMAAVSDPPNLIALGRRVCGIEAAELVHRLSSDVRTAGVPVVLLDLNEPDGRRQPPRDPGAALRMGGRPHTEA